MKSLVRIFLEGSVFEISKKKPKPLSISSRELERPEDRFFKLIHHPEWGPGVKDFIRRNPDLPFSTLMKTIRLKPDIHRWIQTGHFLGKRYSKAPSRQEVHDLAFTRDAIKERLLQRRVQNGTQKEEQG